jgi:16S rRNA (guanine527-N7)-methyltransferase
MMSAETLTRRLHLGLQEFEALNLDESQEAALLSYLDLLRRWNQTYNLTAVTDPGQMITRHILDSLAIFEWVGKGRLLDAGTGAGLPGVPLAIADPELEVTLLDSAGKKVRFLNHVKRELALPNITPVQDRLESYEPDVAFDSLVSRAFSDLASFADAARHLVRPAMRLLAMKGRYPDMELRGLPDDVRVDSVEKLSVPGLQEDRHLVIMSFIV